MALGLASYSGKPALVLAGQRYAGSTLLRTLGLGQHTTLTAAAFEAPKSDKPF